MSSAGKVTHVRLTYFKKTGKFYSDAELDLPYVEETVAVQFHDVLRHVADLLNKGERPGLVNGMEFDVLCVVYTEYGPLPHMFVRDVDGYVGQRSMREKE